MRTPRLTTLALTVGFLCASPVVARAQDNDEPRAITARVHGTFVDKAGGLGVLSGDMTVVRFEVVAGAVTALPVVNVTSTCNQLRMELAATDGDVLQTLVHFDKEVAGFDSRDGTTPKALSVLCATGQLLREKPTADSLAHALNGVAVAMAAKPVR
jgi:hypothetical protein